MYNELILQLLNRDRVTNKYDYGHVLVIGGSQGMIGAPYLCARAALRIGAGLVSIASTSDVIDKLEERVEEIMTFRINTNNLNELIDFINERKITNLAIGPGMDEHFSAFARYIIENTTIPVVLDAGALISFSSHLDELIGERFVITPHDGEFYKLTNIKLSQNREERISQVQRFTSEHKLTFVCKGSPTLIGHYNGDVMENPSGNPGLATAGSGDVLTGIIAGLIAQRIDINWASELGVYLHGKAADIAIETKTQAGLISSDIIESLPDALLSCSQ